MTTISEIEDRLNAVAFSGRSYTGATREEIAAASGLADAASYVAARYAGTPEEAREIRVAIGEPIDALVNIAQGTPIASDEEAQ